MPLYEYCCASCGKKIEIIQKFSDDPLTSCEECGGKLEKLMSAPAIRFKGPGWYVNDYAKKKTEVETSTDGKKNLESKDKPDSKDKPETPAKPSSSSKDETSNNKPKVA